MTGKVSLIGAGPGDPELLTLKALRAIERADLVLYDELVSAEIVARIPPGATAVRVGKRAGRATVEQEEIHRRMIAAARRGWEVVRLKGGDPSVFARSGEEIEALRRAGIEFEIVPGVTAACAAAAAAKIPLTDRRFASKLVFLTGHRAGDASLNAWRAAAEEEATLVVYMPGRDYLDFALELLAGGMDEATPLLVVSSASRLEQAVVATTLGDLPDVALPASPSVLLIGAVAACYQEEARQERTTAMPAVAKANVCLSRGVGSE